MNYRPITDTWILSRPKVPYYGAYPNGFLERARVLLGVTPEDAVLHVCGGAAKAYPNKRRGFCAHDKTLDLDLKLAPDFVQSAEEPLPVPHDEDGTPYGGIDGLHYSGWPAILADPPYTPDDAKHYAPQAYPNPAIILRNMLAAVWPGRRVGILHYLWVRPPKDVRCVAVVSIYVGYGNRGRTFSVYERELEGVEQ